MFIHESISAGGSGWLALFHAKEEAGRSKDRHDGLSDPIFKTLAGLVVSALGDFKQARHSSIVDWPAISFADEAPQHFAGILAAVRC